MNYNHIQVGDIYWCDVNKYGKKNRPCVILEKLGNNKVKVLLITSVESKDNITKLNMSLLDCCQAVGGFLNREVDVVDLDTCNAGNICNCQISDKLRQLLKLYGINV